MSSGKERIECRLERQIDTVTVQQAARVLAERIGFPRIAAIEIAIAASELASNVLKYGKKGNVVLERIEDLVRGSGVRMTAYDEGPPFVDFERASQDRSDQRGPLAPSSFAGRRGIGSGLGAVRRFTHACGWGLDPHGKHVWAERWLRQP